MVWYQRNYTMPYISKNVWCQAHYIQQHHQEEREGILGGCFLCFQFTFTAETAFENSYEDFIYWETAVFCSWRWWEYNFLWSWKSGQTLGFTNEKGENQGLVLWTAELSFRHIYLGRIEGWENQISALAGQGLFCSFKPGFHRGIMGTKECSGLWVSKPLQLLISLDVDSLDLQSFGSTLGTVKATVRKLSEPTAAHWTCGCRECDWEWGF